MTPQERHNPCGVVLGHSIYYNYALRGTNKRLIIK